MIDELALVKALQERTIRGAGIDVYENEPALDNVVIVPHIASGTMATRIRMGEIAVRNLIKALAGQRPDTCVNAAVLKEQTGVE